MEAGYRVIDAVGKGDTICEVRNNHKSNEVINLGWIFPNSAYKTKDNNSVGVWKLKQIKN